MLTVITPTIPGREDLLAECRASVEALGLPHLVLLDEWHDGPAQLRNRMIAAVQTDWVVCLDDDDLLLPNYVDVVRPHLTDADVVYTGWHLTGANDGPFPIPFDPDRLRGENFIPVTACARVEAFRAVGGFSKTARFEDHDLWVRLLDAGYRFAYTPTLAWRYRRRAGSRTDAS